MRSGEKRPNHEKKKKKISFGGGSPLNDQVTSAGKGRALGGHRL